MKKLSPLAVFAIILWALIVLRPLQMAKANAAPPPDPTVGGIGPYQPQKTNVQMMFEKVLIEVPPSPSTPEEPKHIKVEASFRMRNQGQVEEEMQVIFPLTRLNTYSSEEALYHIDPASFVVKVNGQDVPFTTITTPPEVTISESDLHHGFSPDVEWAAFEVTFPVQQDVLLEVNYEMLNPYGEYGEGFTGIAYILETGAGWYGNILSAEITLRLPYEVSEETIKYANPDYVIAGNEMHWKLRDFEPARVDNLEVRVIHADVWQDVLELRSSVEHDPDNAHSWAKLADRYRQLSIFLGREGLLYYQINHHFAELCLEGRQKVVDLRPEWGDAHYRLAEILWFSNPKVEESFSLHGKVKSYIESDDPSIEGVLHELDLAWSYGLSEDVDRWEVEHFLRFVNGAVPDLELTAPPTATTTILPPTDIPAPTESIKALPTVSRMPAITASRIPVPAVRYSSVSYGALIAATFSLALIFSILVYRLRSKDE
jgi:hypothetical protein